MKQFIKFNVTAVRQLRFRVCIAQVLMLVVCFGPAFSLASPVKDSAKSGPVVAPPKRGAVSSRRMKPIFAAPLQAASVLAGQTVTELADGRTLLIGGEVDKGAVDTVAISDPRSGAPVAIKTKLHHGRAWHSATMLPDGRVFVLGGIGRNGEVLRSAELFDPQTQTFTLLTVPEIAAQAYHSATLLTDGQVLITGGSGETLLWDFKTKVFRTLAAKLSAARQKHKATLLFDGNLLIEGGVDGNGNEVTTAELFNVSSGSFNFTTISNEQMEQSAPFLAGSLPANGATEVPVDTFVALRFSKRLRVETVNAQSITLSGQEGTLEAKVVPAEAGRLAFVTPKVPLLPGMTYTVTVADAIDESGAAVAPASSTFTTKKAAEPVDTSADGEAWSPDWTNFKGNWQRKHEDSPWRSLPLLQAAEGVTALAGQVLTLDGKPLANTTLRIGEKAVQTDNTGRFLLAELPAGRQVMVIDGRSASRNKKVYGIFKVGVELSNGKTNPLGYTIWMPRLDTNNVVSLSSPTKAAVKVTNPSIPGLELRLPQGTVIRDLDGQIVTEVSITPIPTNQPPFPLPPNVDVPVYFTIQPGGSQIIPPRAQLVYPNFIGSQPGARIDFYNYDAAEKGWYIYGQGTVTPDGKQIIPDAGVTLYEFSGAMVASPSLAPSTFIPCGRASFGGSGVDLGSGLFVHGTSDMSLGGIGSLSLNRTYRPNDTRSRAFGIGASHIYDMYLVGSTFPYTYMDLVGPDGSRTHFNRISAGTSYDDAVFEAESCGEPTSCAVKAVIKWNAGGWIVIYEDGTKLTFPEAFGVSSPQRSAITGYEDQFGNALSFVRDSSANLTRIASAGGRWMNFTYDTSNRITQVKDNIARTINYSYDTAGRLASVTNAVSGVKNFVYDTSHRMTQITDERGIAILKNEYDTAGRVIKQTFADSTPDPADNPFYAYAYTLDSGGRVAQTDVTDPRGITRRVTFDANGYTTSETYALGLTEQQTITYERQTGTNRLLSVTDNIGRKVTYTYDTAGRITDVTNLAGTAEAVTTHYGYTQSCNCNDVTSVTDPLNHTANFEYDTKHNLTKATDALNNSSVFTYNSAGQTVSVKDALNNTTQLAYDNGDFVGMTDPRGYSGSAFTDGAGRLLSTRAPNGEATRFEYDALDRPIKAIDPLGGVTEFTYDASGNLLSIKDARNNVTSYTYDELNRLTSRTDPLQHVESYEYDSVGLKKFTDRRGKVTVYTYDNLSRITFVGFGATGLPNNPTYESTITYQYNSASQLQQVTDSTSGTTTFNYDNLGRMLSKTTPQGTISYTYDAAGRRTSMTVTGQAAVNYSYDNINRLTQIAQGTRTVAFAYDSISRLTSITQSNGISVEYGYDQTSNLTSIVYKKDTTVLGNLTYEYDQAGKRTKVGGSFARTGMPQALTSATYGTGNRLTQRAGANLTYDDNGNLTNDGTNSYTWNARNQLVSVSGSGLAASFQYDSFGNRTSKTVNSTSNSYLYDGDNIVQELSGTTPTANLLNGGTDQVFNRTDASGARTPLADHLGSILGLADDTGTLQTQYTYDPFGNTTSTGTSSTNSSKYTGREDDGTGLYYYRARYYSPSMQRFISEDPSGFAAGDTNLYAYVANDPINSIDPSGLCSVSAVPGSGSGQRCRVTTPDFDGFASDPRLAPAFDFFVSQFGARSREVWGNWGHRLHAVFLNTTIAASAEGVALGRATWKGFLFSDKDGQAYGIYVSGLTTNDLGRLEFFDPDDSYRSPSSVPNGSVEASIERSGPNRGFWHLDVDLRNPNGNLVRHSLEVVRNLLTQQSTDPLAVAKALQDRGIYTGVGCR
jgi:RHS repeat-associated protein